MTELSLGYSPCPNDTFIFHALTHRLVTVPGLSFRERLEDVETLNGLALAGGLDVTKISFHLLGFIRDDYVLLRSGGALGRGCGPLVVAREDLSAGELAGKRVALPGRHTTAALLFGLFAPDGVHRVYLPFHEIMPAVADGTVDAGVIIHESRFTYAGLGLSRVADLGEWWERETGSPIPLGGIVAKRSLGAEVVARVDAAIRESVLRALERPEEAAGYIRRHAREMDEEVCRAHIGLYVNDFTVDQGAEGEAAVRRLLALAEERGLIPRSARDPYLPR